MLSLYLFAVLLGGGLLLFSLLGGDSDADVDAFDSGNPMQYLSLRTLTYFLFVFGGVGAILTWSWTRAAALLVLPVAVAAGVLVAALASATFGYIRRTNSGDRDSEQTFVGLTGRVSVAMGEGGLGKVLVHRGDRVHELLARPFDAATGYVFGTSVVVVEMNHGTALVTPIDPIALQEETPPKQLEGDGNG
ncbi:MAG: hypothetical protein WDZ58_02665 [Gemmatimonadaceae bacterium]